MRTRLVFLGGYLGAGKTTLAYHLAEALKKDNLSTSLVMNDQGNVLVDTQFMKNAGMDVREITGACFCTKFDEFVKNAKNLVELGKQDVIIAEPIGTSTSLLASVVNPMKTIYGEDFDVAPLMVVVDSHNILLEKRSPHEPGLVQRHLILRHQLNEAEIIILSKQDLLSSEDKNSVKEYVHELAPAAEIIEYSSIDLTNLDKIMEIVRSNRITNKEATLVDQRIFSGEKASLGWYSTHILFDTDDAKLDVYDLMTSLMKGISIHFEPDCIAHAKVLISSPKINAKISLVHDTMRVDGVRGGRYLIGSGELDLNARVIGLPNDLKAKIESVLRSELERTHVKVIEQRSAHFVPRPDSPQMSIPK